MQSVQPIEEPRAEGRKRPRWSPTSDWGDRQWRRSLAAGLAIAVVVHLALLLLFRTTRIPPASPFAAAGPNLGDVRAAQGGEGDQGLEMVQVRVEQPRQAAPEPTPVVPVPVAIPEPVRVEPEQESVDLAERAPEVATSRPGTGGPGEGGERGTGANPGTATGTGRGGGGTAEEGQPGMVAPTPRGMILPPADRPRSVRGQEITVWVFVDARGRVVSDSTRLDPPTPDARYNQRLKRSAAEWVFDPARRDGRPVGAWYPYQIIL